MIGEVVGQYRLEEELGRGTFGVVYRGVHVHMPAICAAVKVLHPVLAADPEFSASMMREVQILDRLQHPGIVQFKTLVVERGRIALLLELLEGEDLWRILRRGQVPADEVVRVATSLAEALAHAHEKGIVHRDIKPANVFRCRDGQVKLLDFGVSHAAAATHAGRTGQIVGTFDYMAPECFEGRSGAPADVYAMGLVIWELLAGRPACPEGAMPVKLRWHLAEEPLDIRAVRPDCPVWLAQGIARMLARRAEDRPAADAVVALVRREGALSGGLGRPPSTVSRKPAGAALAVDPAMPSSAKAGPPSTVRARRAELGAPSTKKHGTGRAPEVSGNTLVPPVVWLAGGCAVLILVVVTIYAWPG